MVTAETSACPSLIFDEVDVGIGGAIAEVVGQLLKQLSQRVQIICVTHLGQVAAQGRQHLRVSKDPKKGSKIEALDTDATVQEIARMLGGVEITDQSLAHAREMFETGRV